MNAVIIDKDKWSKAHVEIAKKVLTHIEHGWMLKICNIDGSDYPRNETLQRLADGIETALYDIAK